MSRNLLFALAVAAFPMAASAAQPTDLTQCSAALNDRVNHPAKWAAFDNMSRNVPKNNLSTTTQAHLRDEISAAPVAISRPCALVIDDFAGYEQGKTAAFGKLWAINHGRAIPPAVWQIATSAVNVIDAESQLKQQYPTTLPPPSTAPRGPGLPLPHYDVEANCRQMSPYDRSNFNWCRNHEQQSYDSLVAMWPLFHDLNLRDWCVAHNNTNSYEILFECEAKELGVQSQQDEMSSSQPFHY